MPLTITSTARTTIPVEVPGIVPDKLRPLDLPAIRSLEVYHGNLKRPLGELFDVSGDPSAGQVEWRGDLSGVHWIGAGMAGGTVRISGDAGRHVGSEMAAGRLEVSGNVGDWLGGEMKGGLISVGGRAGHLVGAAYRGSPRGMTGGTILVAGSAGNEVGHAMRRGLIAIGGQAGDLVGLKMLAGSVLVFGNCGIRPGAGMRRGTLGLFGPHPPRLLPTFAYACHCHPTFLKLVFRQLTDGGFVVPQQMIDAPCALHHGDLLEGGRGEILVTAS